MAGAGVLDFTDENFDAMVLQSPVPVLVDFWAPWCGPCRIVAPTVDQLAVQNGEKFRVGKLNIDASPKAAVKYQVSGIPTLLIFKGGQVVQRFVGITSKDALQKALDQAA